MRAKTQLAQRPMWVLTLGVAASLGVVLYVVSSSVPYLASSITSDEAFSVLNGCALREVESRTGFAVSPSGRSLAVQSNTRAVRCDQLPDGGLTVTTVHATVNDLAFDFSDTLWWSTSAGVRTNDASFDGLEPVAIAGTKYGVLVLENRGRVLALKSSGEVATESHLQMSVKGNPEILVSGDGERAAWVTEGGMVVWQTAPLRQLRAESPCEIVDAVWVAKSHRILVRCATELILDWDVDANSLTPAPPRPQKKPWPTLVPGIQTYISSCEQLPCTADAP